VRDERVTKERTDMNIYQNQFL